VAPVTSKRYTGGPPVKSAGLTRDPVTVGERGPARGRRAVGGGQALRGGRGRPYAAEGRGEAGAPGGFDDDVLWSGVPDDFAVTELPTGSVGVRGVHGDFGAGREGLFGWPAAGIVAASGDLVVCRLGYWASGVFGGCRGCGRCSGVGMGAC